jgi:hypothetical protein
MLLRYLYMILKHLCFDIEFRVLRYRCFLSDPAWAGYSILDTDRGVHIALRINHHPWAVAHAPPGTPSAAAEEARAALGGAAAAPAAAAGAAIN